MYVKTLWHIYSVCNRNCQVLSQVFYKFFLKLHPEKCFQRFRCRYSLTWLSTICLLLWAVEVCFNQKLALCFAPPSSASVLGITQEKDVFLLRLYHGLYHSPINMRACVACTQVQTHAGVRAHLQQCAHTCVGVYENIDRWITKTDITDQIQSHGSAP